MARAYTVDDASAAVRRAVDGQATPADGEILLDLFRRASGRKADRDAAARRDTYERQANALAAVVADTLEGARVDDVVDDLPHDARRRVVAYRHRLSPMRGVPGRDQFGPLPVVPPRVSVMRDRTRTVDAEVVRDEPRRRDVPAIEGMILDVVDERI